MARARSLASYAATRAFFALPMLFILLTAVFVVLRILPGDPVLALWGGRTPPQSAIEAARRQLGLDQPPLVQYVTYLTRVLTGDLGVSVGEFYRGQSVWSQISVRFPATLELAIGGILVAALVGIPLGALGGLRRDKATDVATRLYGIIVFVVPIFWLGLMFQLVFGVWLRWFPANGRWTGTDFPNPSGFQTGMYTIDSLLEGNLEHFARALSHLVLPSLTLGLVLSGFFARAVRANMLRTLSADYTEAARARGVSRVGVIYRHAFRNALVPVVTLLGLTFALLLSGAVLTEKTFSIPGLGLLLLESITSKDITMIQGVVVFYATLIVVVSLAVDIIGAMIDPRIRL